MPIRRKFKRAVKSFKKFKAKSAKKATKLFATKKKSLQKWQTRRAKKAEKRVQLAAKKVARQQAAHRARVQKKVNVRAAKVREATAEVDQSFAAAIINAYRNRAGLRPLFGAAMVDEAQRLVAQKIKSVGFLCAGWIEARNRIRKSVGGRGVLLGGTQAGPRGYASPATFAINSLVSGEVGNTTPSYKRKGGKNFPTTPQRAWTAPYDNVMPHLESGLQKAVAEVTASMKAKLEERLNRSWASIK